MQIPPSSARARRAASAWLLPALLGAACGDAPAPAAPEPPPAAAPSVSGLKRATYGSALIDELPPTHLPRGGTYHVRVGGSGLRSVRQVQFSHAEVSGRIVSWSDTLVSLEVTSQPVDDNFRGTAGLGEVGVTLDGLRAGTLHFVPGPEPVVTLRVVNGIGSVPRDRPVTIQLRAEVRHAGDALREFYCCSVDGTLIRSGTRTEQGYGAYVREWALTTDPARLQASQSVGYTAWTGSGVEGRVSLSIPVSDR